MKNIKKAIIPATVLSLGLLFSGCASSNVFGIGHEKSACGSANTGGFCGSPSAIYKYKKEIKELEKRYTESGYPKKLLFSITREGTINVKEDREDRWQPYENSRYEEEINDLISLKYNGDYASRIKGSNPSASNDLSIIYKKKMELIRTRTNVGDLIRSTGEYTRTWIAPYTDAKGDFHSSNEIYIVLSDPKWLLGENTPKKVKQASTLTPFSRNIQSQIVEREQTRRSTIPLTRTQAVKSRKTAAQIELDKFLNEK